MQEFSPARPPVHPRTHAIASHTVDCGGNLKTACKLSSTCRGAGYEPTTFVQWSNCANSNTYDWHQRRHSTVAAAWFLFQPWQSYPEKMTLFTPNHELCGSGCTFRPLGVFPFTVLLMEGKWSRSAGSFATERGWWFGRVSIWTSQQQLNSCICSPFWGWRKPPVAQQRGHTRFDGFKRRA